MADSNLRGLGSSGRLSLQGFQVCPFVNTKQSQVSSVVKSILVYFRFFITSLMIFYLRKLSFPHFERNFAHQRSKGLIRYEIQVNTRKWQPSNPSDGRGQGGAA